MGGQFKSFTEQHLDSTGIFKDAIIGILATIAKQEHVRLSERTKAGLERARRKGKVIGRPELDPEKIEQIQCLRATGLSIRDIAATMEISETVVCKYLV
ncbi:recombinase family protein [Hymenobacter qilianensis]|uniref:recombinase family protein n=1 Tax=Hymenobacter qilianensis TaxID=1385715 RepID=UPI0035712CF1